MTIDQLIKIATACCCILFSLIFIVWGAWMLINREGSIGLVALGFNLCCTGLLFTAPLWPGNEKPDILSGFSHVVEPFPFNCIGWGHIFQEERKKCKKAINDRCFGSFQFVYLKHLYIRSSDIDGIMDAVVDRFFSIVNRLNNLKCVIGVNNYRSQAYYWMESILFYLEINVVLNSQFVL